MMCSCCRWLCCCSGFPSVPRKVTELQSYWSNDWEAGCLFQHRASDFSQRHSFLLCLFFITAGIQSYCVAALGASLCCSARVEMSKWC